MLAPRHRYSVCSAHRFRGCARLHCNITPNATCDTFTIEWQCELHCHSAPSVLIALPLGLERDAWYVHHRVAVNITLPLGPERS